MTTDDLAKATSTLASDIEALHGSVQLAVGELRRLRRLNADLLAALTQSRCEHCGRTFGSYRGFCEVCADRVAVVAKAEHRD